MRRASIGCAKSVFENSVLGSTGHWPVLSGDSPDGTGATVRGNRHGLFATLFAAVPVGGSPTGAGGSPAPPIFKTGSKRGWFNWNQFHQPLVCGCGDLAGLALVCNTAVIVLVLGLHPGNDILYYHQLITPFLLWKVVRLADTTFKQHSL